MKRSLLSIFAVFTFVTGLSAQASSHPDATANSITIGILQEGGGLLGVDYEVLVAERLGVQVGAGLVSMGAGLTYHSETTVNSNAVWVGVWNQGLPGGSASTAYVGVSYIMRGWGWLNGQIGIAYVPFRGAEAKRVLRDTFADGQDLPPVALLYSLGWYTGF